MRNKLIVLSLLLATIGVVSFGFVNAKGLVEVDGLETEIDTLKVNKNIIKTNLFYAVGGVYLRSVTKSKLQKSRVLSDFIEGYPVNWISAYTSVEISSDYNGGKVNLMSMNDILSDKQKKMLSELDIDAGIIVKVKYNTKNVITDALEKSEMNVSLTVIPEIEAEYIGGYKKMIAYLKDNSSDKIAIISDEGVQPSSLRFLIDKTGRAENVRLIKKSGNTEVDNLLIELIENMPKWNAAKNLKGESISQQFDFRIGADGC